MTLYNQLSIHFEKNPLDHSRTNPDNAWRSVLLSAVGIGGSKRGGGLQPHSPLNLNNIEKSNVTRRKQKKNKETII